MRNNHRLNLQYDMPKFGQLSFSFWAFQISEYSFSLKGKRSQTNSLIQSYWTRTLTLWTTWVLVSLMSLTRAVCALPLYPIIIQKFIEECWASCSPWLSSGANPIFKQVWNAFEKECSSSNWVKICIFSRSSTVNHISNSSLSWYICNVECSYSFIFLSIQKREMFTVKGVFQIDSIKIICVD